MNNWLFIVAAALVLVLVIIAGVRLVNQSKVKRWPVLATVGFLLALCVMCLEFFTPFLSLFHVSDEAVPHYILPLWLGTIGMAVFFFSLFIENWIRSGEELENINGKLERLKELKSGADQLGPISAQIEALRNSQINSFKDMGNAQSLLQTHFKRLCEAVEASTEVWNTLIFFSPVRGTSLDAGRYTEPDNIESRFAIIEKVLSRGKIWNDIHSERGIEALTPKIEAFRNRYGKKYLPKVMTATYPIVNMVLFKREPQDEVWFGFGLFNGYDLTVFRSANRKVCEYFSAYFSILNSDSRAWDEIGRQDVEGAWLSVAYDKDNKLRDCAVVTMRLEGRAISVRGMVFDKTDKEFKFLRSFRSDYSSFYFDDTTPSLVFAFTNEKDGLQGSRGGGFYRFAPMKHPGKFEGYVFTQEGDTRKIAGGRLGKADAEFVTQRDVGKIKLMLDRMVGNFSISSTAPADGVSPLGEPDFH